MCNQHSPSATEHFNKLIQFRQAAYALLGNACDAQFELTDAVIQMRHIQSFVELSCAPAFRRKWSSVYEAMQDGRPDREGLLHLYLTTWSGSERPVFVGDHTAWPRLSANTLADRSYQYQSTRIPGRMPVTIGHGYSTIAIVPEDCPGWVLPVLHERVTGQKSILKAAEQLRQVCKHMNVRPISVWDSGYSNAAFLLATQDIQADKLIRLRTNLCLEGSTKPRRSMRGAAPKHGIKFKFKDPNTWWEPDQVLEENDPKFGRLKIRIWKGLRFSKALDCRMVVAQVEHLEGAGSRRKPKIIWFAWVGEDPPECWWKLYAQRYRIEHWYRFAKGRLHWSLPRFSTSQQSQCWSDLMPFITWELWLARAWVADQPLPWQKPKTNLSPGRVCQGMQNILAVIGTPSRMCKSRGIPSGWPAGRLRTKRERFQVVRSERWVAIRAQQKAQKDGQKAKRGRPKKPSSSAPA
jgi:hypothetical protein